MHHLRSGLSDALRSRTGKPYEVVYVPEEGWLKVREEFIRKNGLAKQQEPNHSDEVELSEEMLSFVQEAEQENADPTCNRGGKDFWQGIHRSL